MYDPTIGRFLSMDPPSTNGVDLLGESPFAYARNNPVNLAWLTRKSSGTTRDVTEIKPLPNGPGCQGTCFNSKNIKVKECKCKTDSIWVSGETACEHIKKYLEPHVTNDPQTVFNFDQCYPDKICQCEFEDKVYEGDLKLTKMSQTIDLPFPAGKVTVTCDLLINTPYMRLAACKKPAGQPKPDENCQR